ncbi:hypothetical protein E4U25_005457 [Claviceps purpurea]|nr:hypothetical protein E4U25_005457 [Claviceps purpurea]
MVFLKAQGLWSWRNSPRQKPWQRTGMPIHRRVVAESPIHFVSGNPICMQDPGKPKPSNQSKFKQTVLTESLNSSSESDKSVEATSQASHAGIVALTHRRRFWNLIDLFFLHRIVSCLQDSLAPAPKSPNQAAVECMPLGIISWQPCHLARP